MKARILCFVLVSLLFSAIVYSQNPYHFVVRWGDGWLGKPMGIVIDSQGILYVSDHFLHRVWKFNTSGQVLGFFGSYGSGDGQFKGPYSLAIDAQDHLYVAEFINHRVQKLDTNGNFIAKWGSNGTGDGQFNGPAYIATDPDGSVYVTERFAPDRVQKFDSDGNFITKWGGTGTADGKFQFPAGIAVDRDGYVYVADSYNHRVQKFDADGNFVAKWGSFGTGPGQFWTVSGIGIDPYGFIYATSLDRVLKFDAGGHFITMWGSVGTADGQFQHSYDIAIDDERYAYVVDGYLVARVQKFAPQFTYVWEGFFRPINNAPAVNSAKAGQAIPVKWRLTDKNGSPVSDPASLIGITSVRVDCGTLAGNPATTVDELAAGSAVLEYLGDGYWKYVWKTSKAYAGQCRTLKLTFNDYCVYFATFSFR